MSRHTASHLVPKPVMHSDACCVLFRILNKRGFVLMQPLDTIRAQLLPAKCVGNRTNNYWLEVSGFWWVSCLNRVVLWACGTA